MVNAFIGSKGADGVSEFLSIGAGGGSGGSVQVFAKSVIGTGKVDLSGGNGSSNGGGGGSGGRLFTHFF